jgi:hypothetical protein
MSEFKYKGYTITSFEDGTFDITENGDLIDGGFKSLKECKEAIDAEAEEISRELADKIKTGKA